MALTNPSCMSASVGKGRHGRSWGAYEEVDQAPSLGSRGGRAMKVILKGGRLVLVPETPTETSTLAEWKSELAGQVLLMQQTSGEGQALIALGVKPEACNEPINVHSKMPDHTLR